MKIYIILFCLLSFSFSFAQTKKIALESHSGKKSELKFEADGNFGNTPEMNSHNPSYAIMIHNFDSINRADSIKRINQKLDSMRFADSLKKPYQKQPMNKSRKKSKAIHGAAAILKPKELNVGFH